MKKIRIEKQIKCSADSLWELFADVTRSDWVPFANEIVLENDVRTFKMDDVGEIKEKIIEKDQVNKSLTYSVIKSPTPLNHHLAKVRVLEDNNFSMGNLEQSLLNSVSDRADDEAKVISNMRPEQKKAWKDFSAKLFELIGQ